MAALVALAGALVLSRHLLDWMCSGRLRADIRARPLSTVCGFAFLAAAVGVFWAVSAISVLWWIDDRAAVGLVEVLIHRL